jgi:hypothetical protein
MGIFSKLTAVQFTALGVAAGLTMGAGLAVAAHAALATGKRK